jgi:DNA topoisomerase IB
VIEGRSQWNQRLAVHARLKIGDQFVQVVRRPGVQVWEADRFALWAGGWQAAESPAQV